MANVTLQMAGIAGATHNIYPRPGAGIVSAIPAPQPHYHNGPNDGCHAAPEYPQYCLASPLRLADLESPDLRAELTVANYTHDSAMRSTHVVVEAHGCFWCLRVSLSILRLYGRGVEDGCIGYGVRA